LQHRILVKNSTNGAANGIYVVTTAGTGANGVWDRATDFDADTEVTANAFMFIEGTTLADTAWVLTTNDSITVGAAGTAMTFTQFRCRRRYFSYLYSYGGLQGSSSGGNSPVITLSTTLAAGPVKSNGLERLYHKQLLWWEVWNSCSREWWYRSCIIYFWWFT
jgi:hypothetical protein